MLIAYNFPNFDHDAGITCYKCHKVYCVLVEHQKGMRLLMHLFVWLLLFLFVWVNFMDEYICLEHRAGF
jgi:hypothetical protein